MVRYFSRVLALVLSLALLFSFSACAPDYTGDERLGSYGDMETGAYTLVLKEDGTGTFYHVSVHGPVTEEAIVFELTGNEISILGDGSGMLGKGEYRGTFEKESETYVFALKDADSGNLFATFYRMGN